MRERIARAIEASMFAPHELPIEGKLHERYLECADDIIAAMRVVHRKIGEYDAEIFWSDEDGGFIGIVPSLPGCSAFGETEDIAEYELHGAIAAWLEARVKTTTP